TTEKGVGVVGRGINHMIVIGQRLVQPAFGGKDFSAIDICSGELWIQLDGATVIRQRRIVVAQLPVNGPAPVVSLRIIRIQSYRLIEIVDGIFKLPFFDIGARAVVVGWRICRISVGSIGIFFDGIIEVLLRRLLISFQSYVGRFLP